MLYHEASITVQKLRRLLLLLLLLLRSDRFFRLASLDKLDDILLRVEVLPDLPDLTQGSVQVRRAFLRILADHPCQSDRRCTAMTCSYKIVEIRF